MQPFATLTACAALLLPGQPLAAPHEQALDLTSHWAGHTALGVFILAYLLIALRGPIKLRKSKPVVLAAGMLWLLVAIAYVGSGAEASVGQAVRRYLLDYGQLLLFLLVTMTYMNALDERQLFDGLRAWLVCKGLGYRALFWVTGWLSFFIAPFADNLTTALLMGSVVLALGVDNPRFTTLACINIVVAANAGGIFSPFGDVTTLMVWQKDIVTPQGEVDFWSFFQLFVPALVSFAVPAACMHFSIPDRRPPLPRQEVVALRRGARRILLLFGVTLVLAVSAEQFFRLPPVIGMTTGLALLQFFGYYLKKTHRPALDMKNASQDRGVIGDFVPYDIFDRVARAEWDTLLFIYGVVLCVGALAFMGYLTPISQPLYHELGPTTANVLIGLVSAVVDNIPVMSAVLTMSPEMSKGQWLLVTLTTGVGGSLLSTGSVAGLALMGQARGRYSFSGHLKWTWAIALGYAGSILTHLQMSSGPI